MVVALIALFVAMGGSGYAATQLPGKASDSAAKRKKKPRKHADRAQDIALIRQQAAKLRGPRGFRGLPGANGTNGTNGTNGVKGDKGDQGPAGPITGTLPSGVTLRGHWAIRFQSGATAVQRVQTPISFGFTLASAPTPNFIPLGGAVPAGCAGGTPTAPAAQPGNLCVFEQANDNINVAGKAIFNVAGTDGQDDAFGAGLAANTIAATTDTRWRGSWAVTAP
jgi:hypothetical protein